MSGRTLAPCQICILLLTVLLPTSGNLNNVLVLRSNDHPAPGPPPPGHPPPGPPAAPPAAPPAEPPAPPPPTQHNTMVSKTELVKASDSVKTSSRVVHKQPVYFNVPALKPRKPTARHNDNKPSPPVRHSDNKPSPAARHHANKPSQAARHHANPPIKPTPAPYPSKVNKGARQYLRRMQLRRKLAEGLSPEVNADNAKAARAKEARAKAASAKAARAKSASAKSARAKPARAKAGSAKAVKAARAKVTSAKAARAKAARAKIASAKPASHAKAASQAKVAMAKQKVPSSKPSQHSLQHIFQIAAPPNRAPTKSPVNRQKQTKTKDKSKTKLLTTKTGQKVKKPQKIQTDLKKHDVMDKLKKANPNNEIKATNNNIKTTGQDALNKAHEKQSTVQQPDMSSNEPNKHTDKSPKQINKHTDKSPKQTNKHTDKSPKEPNKQTDKSPKQTNKHTDLKSLNQTTKHTKMSPKQTNKHTDKSLKDPTKHPDKTALVTKQTQLKTYLHEQQTKTEEQLHDAERKLAQAYLVFRLYGMLQNYLTSTHDCEDHSIGIRVGVHSPVFGGLLVDSPTLYISEFSISGFDDSMSRAEVYGCKTLPSKTVTDKTAPISPCGPGPYKLLWAWYNGQPLVTMPPGTAVLAGYKTDVHFLVARLVKFALTKTHDITLQEKLVKLTFSDCVKPKPFLLSNYQFSRRVSRHPLVRAKLNIGMACTVQQGFTVYGYIGQMGVFGREAAVWVNNNTQTVNKLTDKRKVGKLTNEQANTQQDRVLGSLRTSNKIHKLASPVQIKPGDVLKVRCQYYDITKIGTPPVITPYTTSRTELCALTLLTMVPSAGLTALSGGALTPQSCSAPSDLPEEDDRAWDVIRYIQTHRYAMVVLMVMMVLLGYCLVRRGCAREEAPARRRRRESTEFQGLLNEYTEFEDEMKLK